ncbi:DUF5615 family PIN-like protein [Kineococcus gypseus]|uniref:DUF5615 family PIN-like protein n=1 Tax=Kineococcus gypseus TaxID=1637102 RepID=UPI003D7E76D2
MLIDECLTGVGAELDEERFDVQESVERLGAEAPDDRVAGLAHEEQRLLLTNDRRIAPHIRSTQYQPAAIVVTNAQHSRGEQIKQIRTYVPQYQDRIKPGLFIDLRKDQPRVVDLRPDLPPPRQPGQRPTAGQLSDPATDTAQHRERACAAPCSIELNSRDAELHRTELLEPDLHEPQKEEPDL